MDTPMLLPCPNGRYYNELNYTWEYWLQGRHVATHVWMPERAMDIVDKYIWEEVIKTWLT